MKPAFSSISRICDLLLLFFFLHIGLMRKTIGNLFNHLFSLRQSLFFPVLLGHILLATLVHSGCWKDTGGALRGSFIFTCLMNNNIIFSIFIRYWISNFWIGSPRLSHSSWLFSLLINLYVLYIFFHLSPFSEIYIANIV